MTLGEVLASLLEGTGQAAQHQYAGEIRGADYRQKEEQLARTGENVAIAQGNQLRDAELKRAAVRAAAQQAASSGVAQRGMSDEEAAAALEQSRTTATHEAGLARTDAQNELSAARALAASGQLTPALLAKLASGEKIADTRAGAITGAATIRANAPKAPRRPRMGWIKGPDGRAVQGDLDQPGVERAPSEKATREGASTDSMIAALGAMERIPKEWLGPKAGMVRDLRSGLMADVVGVDPPEPEEAQARALVGAQRDDIVHALTGAAASVPEMARLIQHIPDMDKQRDTIFYANVRMTKAGLEIARALETGQMSPQEASQRVTALLGSMGGRAAAPAGSVPAAPSTPVKRIRVDEQGNVIG